MEGNLLKSDVELVSEGSYDLNNIYEIDICNNPIDFAIKDNKIIINKNLFSCNRYQGNERIIYIYDGILNPIFNINNPNFDSSIFIIDDDSFKLPIRNSYIKDIFKEIKSDNGFYFKIEDNKIFRK